jgi:hypothetical protein
MYRKSYETNIYKLVFELHFVLGKIFIPQTSRNIADKIIRE